MLSCILMKPSSLLLPNRVRQTFMLVKATKVIADSKKNQRQLVKL